MDKKRAGLGIENEEVDFEGILNSPPPPKPTPEQEMRMKVESEKLGFVSRHPRITNKPPATVKTKAISFLVDESLHRAFKIKATQNGEHMAEVMERLIEKYINS